MRPGDKPGELILDQRQELLALQKGLSLRPSVAGEPQLSHDIESALVTRDFTHATGISDADIPLRAVADPQLSLSAELAPTAVHACDEVIAKNGLLGFYYRVRGYKEAAFRVRAGLWFVGKTK